MSPRDRPQPCRHERQKEGACADCGHRFGESRTELQARAEDLRGRVLLLGDVAKEQYADAGRVWRSYKMTIGLLLGMWAVDRRAARALDVVVDQVVLFDARCKAGDVEGAVLALRSWLARIGT